MPETTWIIDSVTGALTVEGLSQSSLTAMTDEWLSQSVAVNCARPFHSSVINGLPILPAMTEPSLRVHRIYHHSVVEGPGRRSVLQVAGCERRCIGCYVPETHDLNGGVQMSLADVAAKLLAKAGAPRDGITILGGEPFLQPTGLLTLLQWLKAKGQHITLYTGFTLEELQQRDDASTRQILALTDILIDGPFVKELTENAGEWRGSTNQRILHQPVQYLTFIQQTV
ncbi:MAG: 4Fe-4S cluster-binding domain-containing protein [Blastocatellia bacterium]|nr:4Fe-4S cluster-binding domain-containing protein [Blastocatellia bacterium]